MKIQFIVYSFLKSFYINQSTVLVIIWINNNNSNTKYYV